jgi:hypothetical protein
MRGAGRFAAITMMMSSACASADTRVHVGDVHATAIAPQCAPVQSCIGECRATKESTLVAADVCREECVRLYEDADECRRDCQSCCAPTASSAPDDAAVACCPVGSDQSCEAFCSQRDSARNDCFGVCELIRTRATETAERCIAGCSVIARR